MIKKLVLLLLAGITVSYGSVGWNDLVETDLRLHHAGDYYQIHLDAYADSDGIHLVFDIYDTLMYALVDSEGDIVRQSVLDTHTMTEFPSISGHNGLLYVVYAKNDDLLLKTSTNAGTSWSNEASNSTVNEEFSGLDATSNDQGLHVVWSTETNDDPHSDIFDTYYSLFSTSTGWGTNQEVTNYGSATLGGNPTISLSEDRAHIAFNYGTERYNGYQMVAEGTAFTRDKNLSTGSWYTPQTLHSSYSAFQMLVATDDDLHGFYVDSRAWGDTFHRERTIASSSWPTGLGTSVHSLGNMAYGAMSATINSDQDVDFVYLTNYIGSYADIKYRQYSSSWGNATTIVEDELYETYRFLSSSAVGDDIYVVIMRVYSAQPPVSGQYFEVDYIQYDALPETPANFTKSGSVGQNPTLSWSANIEPDLDYYQLYKQENGGNWFTWTTVDKGTTSRTDNGVTIAVGKFVEQVCYKITAVDVGGNESPASIPRCTGVDGISKGVSNNSNSLSPEGFSVLLPYPNPFNPSTSIQYTLPKPSSVSIAVSNMKGNIVANYRQENQSPGFYEYAWNGVDDDGIAQPSGIYIFTFSTPDYRAIHKAVLVR